VRHLLGLLLGLFVRAWIATLRVRVEGYEVFRAGGRPHVLAFCHGQQMALLAMRPGRGEAPLAVPVSLSRDGELQSGVLSALGLLVIRGSSSRRGSTALLGLLRAARSGRSLAFAVDGPRGPAGIAKPGAAFAATSCGFPLLPVAGACRTGVALKGAWDAFEIPLPFSRVAIVVGPALPAGDPAEVSRTLDRALRAARSRAEHIVRRPRGAPITLELS